MLSHLYGLMTLIEFDLATVVTFLIDYVSKALGWRYDSALEESDSVWRQLDLDPCIPTRHQTIDAVGVLPEGFRIMVRNHQHLKTQRLSGVLHDLHQARNKVRS